MNRKNFIQKTILGTGILIGSKSAIDILKNDIDELAPLDSCQISRIKMCPESYISDMYFDY